VAQRLAPWEAEHRAVIQTAEDAGMKKVQQLLTLQGMGTNSAGVLVTEFFSWRALRNGKDVGALSGLPPMPYASGHPASERGIAKAGNSPMRAMAIAMAWGWRRLQPESALTQWALQRFGHGSRRLRRRGMGALARKRLSALWRVVETGVWPDGAALKAPVRL
jgi:transposase